MSLDGFTNWFMGPKVTPKQQDLRCRTGESLIKPEVQWWVSTYTVSTLGLNGVSGTLSVFFFAQLRKFHISGWLYVSGGQISMFLRGFPWRCCHAQMLPCFDTKGRQLGLGFKGFDPENWVMAGSRMQMVFLSATIFSRIIFGDDNDGDLKPLTTAFSFISQDLKHCYNMLQPCYISSESYLCIYIYTHIFLSFLYLVVDRALSLFSGLIWNPISGWWCTAAGSINAGHASNITRVHNIHSATPGDFRGLLESWCHLTRAPLSCKLVPKTYIYILYR